MEMRHYPNSKETAYLGHVWPARDATSVVLRHDELSRLSSLSLPCQPRTRPNVLYLPSFGTGLYPAHHGGRGAA